MQWGKKEQYGQNEEESRQEYFKGLEEIRGEQPIHGSKKLKQGNTDTNTCGFQPTLHLSYLNNWFTTISSSSVALMPKPFK